MSAARTAKAWRRRLGAHVVVGGLVLAASAAGAAAALASDPPNTPQVYGLTGSAFESKDGNTAPDGTYTAGTSEQPRVDWDTGGIGAHVVGEESTGSTDNSFGNGTKEDTAVPSVVAGGIPPNKSDLKEFGSYAERNADGQFLHLLWTRVQDPSGTTNMDFEFNKLACVKGVDVSGCSANGVTPKRSERDLLITYDLSKGGTVPTIEFRRWSAASQLWGTPTSLNATVATGSINEGAITSSRLRGSYSARTFGEASINMASIFSPDVCEGFGSAYLKSRSSDSFTAALKDFIAPIGAGVSNCGGLKINKKDDAGTAMSGVVFTLHEVNADGSKGAATGFTCTTTSTGNCTFVDAESNSGIRLGDYLVEETTYPSGYTPATDFRVSVTATSAGTPINKVNNRNPASITFVKKDDLGNPLQGVGFTLYRDAPSTAAADGFATATAPDRMGAEDVVTSPAIRCTTTATGTCTMSGILEGGPYWIKETTNAPGYAPVADYRVTVALGQSVDLSTVAFTDPRQFTVVTLVCVDNTSRNATSAATPGLYGSKVAYGGSPLPAANNTLTAVPPALAAKGVTAADLCALGGGALAPAAKGAHSASLAIP